MDNWQKTAEIAAQWWANAIAAPKFDNGDKSPAGGMGMVMATLLSADHVPTSEQVETFKCALTARIIKDQPFWLSVDYGPDGRLADAASEADIHPSRFPWKTHMQLTEDSVKVSAGYGSESEDIR